MTCATCGGLVIDNYGEQKCINCGRAPGQSAKPPAPVPEKISPLTISDQRHEGTTMGKWSEETRAAFKEKLRAAWAKKRKGGSTAVVPAKSAALTVKPVRTIDAVAGVALDLDSAIEKRRNELAVLEQAKEIVLRG